MSPLAAARRSEHAVRNNVDRSDRLAVVIFQTGQKLSESGSQIFDGRFTRNHAIVKKETHFAVRRKHLIGRAECAGERNRRAILLIAIKEYHRRFRLPWNRHAGGNELRTCWAEQQQQREQYSEAHTSILVGRTQPARGPLLR